MPQYPEHLRCFDYIGPYRYFLTFCSWERVRHFKNAEHVALVCEQFQRAVFRLHFRRTTGLPLWQRYGFERVLRSDEATEMVARYTIANPVRAGLVQSPADYPFWGSFLYTREELLEYIGRAT